MINKVLVKKSIKSNYKIITIIMCVIVLYCMIIIGMYTPGSNKTVDAIKALDYPPELLNAFGFNLEATTLIGFISSFLYGMIMIVFPMIAYIVIANRLVALMVDKGSMACILSKPVSRKKVAVTQAVFLIVSVIIMVILSTVYIIAQIKFTDKGSFNTGTFIKLNLGLLLLHYALSSICFIFSCIFNDSSKSLTFGAGIPILFYVIKMLSDSGEKVQNFKYATIMTLFNPQKITSGENVVLPFLLLFAIGTILYILSIYIFNRKDMCL